jgi:signal transduction histidine kinase
MESANILIVEDNTVIRKAIESILKKYGYNVIIAIDGQEALNILSGHMPDLIISDIMMPNLNGYEFYKQVRNMPEFNIVPFIFLTALDEEKEVREAKELGVDDYLTKPFTREDLISVVKGKLKRKSQIKHSTSKEIEELKKDIIMTLTHEFNTPLTIIRGFTSLLLRDDLSLEEHELKELLNCIKAGGDRLGELTSDFTAMIEIESGFLDKEVAILYNKNNINSIIDSLKYKYTSITSEKNIEIYSDLKQDLPLFKFSDKHMSLAMGKIIDNAIKFSDKEKNVIKINTYEEKDVIFIEIEDNGPGIAENEFENIFKKFYQIDRRNTEQQGAGMGLTISKAYIEANGGKIYVKSNHGEGTKFVITFPVLEIEDA